jgi:transposase-like protein
MSEPVLSEQDRDRIVELYQQGTKLVEITRLTGVPRSTIYWVLRKRGVEPERITRPSRESLGVDEVLAQLAEANRTIGQLQERLDRERALNEALMQRLQQTD